MRRRAPIRFPDRRAAGRQLGAAVAGRVGSSAVVVGLPRGGVPVAAELADALGAPLDVLVVRKLGAPAHPELGIGAIGEDGVRVVDAALQHQLGVSDEQLARVEAAEQAELARRVARYRGGRPRIPLAGRTVVIADDGIATGGTVRAAVALARAEGASRVVVAAPVAPPEVADALRTIADEVITLAEPDQFGAVGAWYGDFTPTSDEEVVAALATGPAVPAARAGNPARRVVRVVDGAASLEGELDIPAEPRGVVVFAHGSDSSRFSPRNAAVAHHLNGEGFATLVFDLLTESEARDRRRVFDIQLLAHRLGRAVDAARSAPELARLPIGLFGASTGAGAALLLAAYRPGEIGAIVSRGGRPDLALHALDHVTAPTLLIVGGDDLPTIEANELAATRLRAEHRLEIVPGATHLFAEPGALERVARSASEWFGSHLHRGRRADARSGAAAVGARAHTRAP